MFSVQNITDLSGNSLGSGSCWSKNNHGIKIQFCCFVFQGKPREKTKRGSIVFFIRLTSQSWWIKHCCIRKTRHKQKQKVESAVTEMESKTITGQPPKHHANLCVNICCSHGTSRLVDQSCLIWVWTKLTQLERTYFCVSPHSVQVITQQELRKKEKWTAKGGSEILAFWSTSEMMPACNESVCWGGESGTQTLRGELTVQGC